MKKFAVLFRAARPHQWAKNLLVFVPLLASHRAWELDLLARTFLAFLAFCACASAIYLVNDVVDVESDRRHPAKRHRPIAAGEVSPQTGALLACGLGALGLGLAWAVGGRFAVTLVAYAATALIYTWHLKRQPLLDVFCLAGLYGLRLLGGQEATGITCSEWLLAFSLFFFLSLGILKRFQEAFSDSAPSLEVLPGRGYSPRDADFLSVYGFVCGALAVLVLALYANSEQVRHLYRKPAVLLALGPLILYWFGRVWLLAHRRSMHHDPVAFALRDRVSWAVAVVGAIILILAK